MKLQVLNKKLIVGALLAVYAVSASALETRTQQPKRMSATGYKTQQPQRAPLSSNLQVQKPQTAKEDLIVFTVGKNLDGSLFAVIKNIGKVKSESGKLGVKNTANGGFAEASIVSIEPGEAYTVPKIVLNKKPNKGNLIRFHADYQFHVSESNENNNVKTYTYQ